VAVRDAGVSLVDWTTHDAAGVRRPGDEIRRDLATLLARERPALVHANSLSMARLAGPVLREAGVPSVGHMRDIVGLSRQAIDDVNCCTRLVAVSEATRAFHTAQGIDAAKCVVVNNGVDLDEFRPRAESGYLHRELALPPRARLVASIGQVGMRKGTDVALAAAMKWATAVAEVHWLVVGERTSKKEEAHELERELHARAKEPPLVGRVHFLGTRNDVSRLLPECTLLIHAARQEPLGRVLLEAAACGLPVVATDVGGTREIFPSESDGAVLVGVDDDDSLARAVCEFLQDDARRERIGSGGRRRAKAAFDVRQAAARLIDVYHSVLVL
jgi:glycosyltransferase involved in cell wall biosynthesis